MNGVLSEFWGFGVKFRKEAGLMIKALELSFSKIFTAFNQNDKQIHQYLLA